MSVTTSASTPSKPTYIQEAATSENLQVYIIYYRHGMNPHCQKGFVHKGDLRSAVDRAKTHCAIMGYRYIFVRPLICDLAEDEKSKSLSLI